MIQPTNGRVVLYAPGPDFPGVRLNFNQKLAAIVAHVWHDRRVNLSVIDSVGKQHPVEDVQLLQDDDRPVVNSWCEWMPYQKGQAAKTEAAEAAALKS